MGRILITCTILVLHIMSKPVILQESGSPHFLAKEKYKKIVEWVSAPASVVGPEGIVDIIISFFYCLPALDSPSSQLALLLVRILCLLGHSRPSCKVAWASDDCELVRPCFLNSPFIIKTRHGSLKRCPVDSLNYRHVSPFPYYVKAIYIPVEGKRPVTPDYNVTFFFVCWSVTRKPKWPSSSQIFKFSRTFIIPWWTINKRSFHLPYSLIIGQDL